MAQTMHARIQTCYYKAETTVCRLDLVTVSSFTVVIGGINTWHLDCVFATASTMLHGEMFINLCTNALVEPPLLMFHL